MGCSPAKSQEVNCYTSQIPQNDEDNLLSPPALYHRIKRRATMNQKKSKISERSLSEDSHRRHTIPVAHLNGFWSTMPISILIDRLNLLHSEVLKARNNYNEIVSYIRNILADLSSSIENSAYKTIHKNNKEFKQFIGKYVNGIPFMKILGYRDKENLLELVDEMTNEIIKLKEKQFEVAVLKVEGKTDKTA